MKKIVFQNAIGQIILGLSSLISGGFITEITGNSFIVRFNHNHKSYEIEIQNENSLNMNILLNGKFLDGCINVDNFVNNLKVLFN